jgi:hypothetical protein
MSVYNGYDDESSGFSISRFVGMVLTFIGAVVIIWTVVEIFQLFTQGSAFVVLDGIVPQRIVLTELAGDGYLLLPRELLIFGLPIWALSVTTKIGMLLIQNGLQYVELPRRGGAKPVNAK